MYNMDVVLVVDLKGGEMRPSNFIVRCYARKTRAGVWYAHCIDLNLDSEAKTLEEAKVCLDSAIRGYIKTVIDSNDKRSIMALIQRKSSYRHFSIYYFIKLLMGISAQRKAFDELLPIQYTSEPLPSNA